MPEKRDALGNCLPLPGSVSVDHEGTRYTAQCETKVGVTSVFTRLGPLSDVGGVHVATQLLREYVATGGANSDPTIRKEPISTDG